MKATDKPALPAEMEVTVLRSFYYDRNPTKVGAKVTLPRIFALEMIAANKAERVKEQAPATEATAKPAAEKPAEKPAPAAKQTEAKGAESGARK